MDKRTGLPSKLRNLFSGFGAHHDAVPEDHTASRVMQDVIHGLVGHSAHGDAPETGDIVGRNPGDTPTRFAGIDLSNPAQRNPTAGPIGYADAMIQSGNVAGLNRVGDTYMQSYYRSHGRDQDALLSAGELYTHAALNGSMDGLSNLYDCHRHGLQTPIPQYQALFDLVDYTRQIPGASATKTYSRMINGTGLPEAEATELRDDIWNRISQKYARAARVQQRVDVPRATATATASIPG